MNKFVALGLGATAVASFGLGALTAAVRPPPAAPVPQVTVVQVTATSRNLEPADLAKAAGPPVATDTPWPTAAIRLTVTPFPTVEKKAVLPTPSPSRWEGGTATPTSAPTVTFTPRPATAVYTATPRPYPTSPPQPVASAPAGGANVYAFPAEGAQVVSTLGEGRSAVVTGRTKDSQWLAVFVNGKNGWLRASSVRVVGEVKFADVVAFSTPTRVPATAIPVAKTCYRTGATCRDGTHSNATGQGACSHHGGVAVWLETCTP